MFIYLLVTMLPLLEIAGFVIVGGRIGVGDTILWLIADIIGGIYFLTSMGSAALVNAGKSVGKDVYPLREMFDVICVLIGALLLMFPGFVSDALALLFLVPWLRAGIFLFLKSFHESVLEEVTKKGEGFAGKYYEHDVVSTSKVIEGEFTVVKDKKENDDLH